MRKPDKNSKRQRLLALNIGQQMSFARDEIKIGSLGSLLFTLKQDEGKCYSYRVEEQVVTVTRIS